LNININDGERYVPSIFGNDKDDKPMAFNIRFLTVRDQDEIEYYEVVSVKSANRLNMKTNFQEAFKRGVSSIENCTVNGKAITTAEDFLSVRGSKKFATIMQDVAMHIKEASEVDEKN
jgi:hypothetical protein